MNLQKLTTQFAKGWNTWDTSSVTSFVNLPSGFAVNLGVKEFRNCYLLKKPLIGLRDKMDPHVSPGIRSYDGSYTSQAIDWLDIHIEIETASDGDDYVFLVKTKADQQKYPCLIVESAMLWNRPGKLSRHGNSIKCEHPDGREINLYSTNDNVNDVWAGTSTPFLMLSTSETIGLSTGKKRSLEEITGIVEAMRNQWLARVNSFGDLADTYTAMQSPIAWNTIYDPKNDRVTTSVSRNWNMTSGGYVLFCWDTYFVALMSATDNKELAFSNAIAISKTRLAEGFVPNCSQDNLSSKDRSQPPVGSLMCLEIFKKHSEKWFLEEVYNDLLAWNRWWIKHRMTDGLLCWGSDPYDPVVGNFWESEGVNGQYGAALESGLDNSPMYDDIPFDPETHQLKLHDVGLASLYIVDCDALSEIARILGKTDDAEELHKRAEVFREKTRGLWNDKFGLFLNRKTDTGEFSTRISPTNFYPLIAKVATQQQAERMINEHFYNPDEFWGDWILPSISRNDPAYIEQSYWRGRIWAPMNFLVYLGLKNYDLPQPAKDLAERSNRLILKEWLEFHHVHENYSADTGEGCDKENSDRFYPWGGLLGLIALLENGCV